VAGDAGDADRLDGMGDVCGRDGTRPRATVHKAATRRLGQVARQVSISAVVGRDYTGEQKDVVRVQKMPSNSPLPSLIEHESPLQLDTRVSKHAVSHRCGWRGPKEMSWRRESNKDFPADCPIKVHRAVLILMSQSEARSGESSGRGDNRAESGLTVLAFLVLLEDRQWGGCETGRAVQAESACALSVCRHGAVGRITRPAGCLGFVWLWHKGVCDRVVRTFGGTDN
jgi:hypothetical protein